MSNYKKYTLVLTESDVTSEILEMVAGIVKGWPDDSVGYATDRLESMQLSDGTYIDLGEAWTSPAIKKIDQYTTEIMKRARNE